MTPSQIKEKEDAFYKTLINKTNAKYQLVKQVKIGENTTMYSIRPSYSSYYYPQKTKKTSICLHFTVGYINSDVATLAKEDSKVSVSYLVDRCGRVYELFDDAYWSYHLGAGAVGTNTTMSKQSIGIEISNYGPLSASGSDLIDVYNNKYCTIGETTLYECDDFRGKKYFATMSNEQLNAVAELLKYLCGKHGIPMNFRKDASLFASDADARNFGGIFYHTSVRKDKFDWPFGRSISSLVKKCSV